MNQVSQLTHQISEFASESQTELDFLFDSLLLSLKTASKHAATENIGRAVPSMRHAQNLSNFLAKALLKVPVPSLHAHINDLFAYFQRTLEDNLRIPIKDELDELLQLTFELRKGIHSLLETEVPNKTSHLTFGSRDDRAHFNY
jgi:flagellin-specific chaperone FliS